MNWAKIRQDFFDQNKELQLTTKQKNIIVNWFIEKTTKKIRSNAQNSALHLYFTMLAEQLNEAGHTFTNCLGMEIPFTMELIKESIWKPTQAEMFKLKTTKYLTTEMINKLIDVFSLHFGKRGIYVEFPNWQRFLNRLDSKKY